MSSGIVQIFQIVDIAHDHTEVQLTVRRLDPLIDLLRAFRKCVLIPYAGQFIQTHHAFHRLQGILLCLTLPYLIVNVFHTEDHVLFIFTHDTHMSDMHDLPVDQQPAADRIGTCFLQILQYLLPVVDTRNPLQIFRMYILMSIF